MTKETKTLDQMQITRVIINRNGNATPPSQARNASGELIKPTIVYERNDGWTLGAPTYLSNVARELWLRDWVRVWRLDGSKWVLFWDKATELRQPKDMNNGELIEWIYQAVSRKSRGARKGRALQIIRSRHKGDVADMAVIQFRRELAAATNIWELKEWAMM